MWGAVAGEPLLRPAACGVAGLRPADTCHDVVGDQWWLSHAHLGLPQAAERASVCRHSQLRPAVAPAPFSPACFLFPINVPAPVDTLKWGPIITSHVGLAQFALNLQAALCRALCQA